MRLNGARRYAGPFSFLQSRYRDPGPAGLPSRAALRHLGALDRDPNPHRGTMKNILRLTASALAIAVATGCASQQNPGAEAARPGAPAVERAPLESWAEVWENVRRSATLVDALNMDRKQAALLILMTLARASRM